uniref:Uncharacterized protein n=1 Tax=Romanomermis culicivorax TaxID=13658 RepID=A0A915HW63_ROMCU
PKIKKIFIPDDRGEPAHFLIKATSNASGASLLLNKQELATNGECTEPAPFLIESTPTQSEAPSLLSMEESGMLDQKEYVFLTSST